MKLVLALYFIAFAMHIHIGHRKLDVLLSQREKRLFYLQEPSELHKFFCYPELGIELTFLGLESKP